MRIALIQMKVEAGKVLENRERGLRLACKAAEKADILVFPEIWTIGYALRDVSKWAEEEDGPTLTALAEIARRQEVTIITGSIPFRRDDKIYNGAFVINKDGQIMARYEKIHLFSLLGEERFFTGGQKRTTFSLGEVQAGLAICYDLRFPELFRALTLDGAKIIFVPAEWPALRATNWRLLNQARAIENQVFICAVNCVGQHRENVFCGHSMLIAPSGEILVEGDGEESILYGIVDLNMVDEARQEMTVWKDRRPDMYI